MMGRLRTRNQQHRSPGFGNADPVASNDTAAGRAQNRRVELVLAGSGN